MAKISWKFVPASVACVTGRWKGGKSKGAREDSARSEGEQPARALLCSWFFFFFFSPNDRKNPDWSYLTDYWIHPSHWSATHYLREWRSSRTHIQQGGLIKGSFRTISRRNTTIFVGRKCLKQSKRKRLNKFLGKGYFSRFTYRLWKESHFSASCFAREKSQKICIIYLSLFRIINDQIVDVEATNLTACNLA